MTSPFETLALSRRTLLAGAGASLLLPAAARRAGAAPATGGTLVAVLDPEPAGLVAGLTISAPAVAVSANIFDGLVEYDEGFKLRPSLATSWETSADGTVITFRLRDDVTWHDGAPFTSADVAYSLMEVTKKVHPRGNAVFANLTAVETPDPHTAVLRFSRPSPVVWAAFNGTETQILPKHLYEGTNPLTNPWNDKPIGTGAFVFKEWVKGERIVLARREGAAGRQVGEGGHDAATAEAEGPRWRRWRTPFRHLSPSRVNAVAPGYIDAGEGRGRQSRRAAGRSGRGGASHPLSSRQPVRHWHPVRHRRRPSRVLR